MILDEEYTNDVDERRKQKIIETINNNDRLIIFNLHFITWDEKSDREYVKMFKDPMSIKPDEHNLYTEAKESMNVITNKLQRDLYETNWYDTLESDIKDKIYIANNVIIPYRMPIFSKRALDFVWKTIHSDGDESLEYPIKMINVLLEKAKLPKSPIYISLAYSVFMVFSMMDSDERHLVNFQSDKPVIIFPINVMSKIVENETDYFMKLSTVFQDVVLPVMNVSYTDTMLNRSEKLKDWYDTAVDRKMKVSSVFSTDWSEIDMPILEFLEIAKEEENEMSKPQ